MVSITQKGHHPIVDAVRNRQLSQLLSEVGVPNRVEGFRKAKGYQMDIMVVFEEFCETLGEGCIRGLLWLSPRSEGVLIHELLV